MSEMAFDLYQLARGEMNADDIDAAVVHFRQSLDLDMHYKTAELLGECLMKKGKVEDAISVLRKSVAAGKAPRSALLLAEAYLQAGLNSDARQAIDEALRDCLKNRFSRAFKRVGGVEFVSSRCKPMIPRWIL